MKSILIWLFAFGTAYAGLTDYVAHVQSNPCSDGWAECVIEGKVMNVTGHKSDGIIHGSSDRVDFWTFQPLEGLSPFVNLEAFPDVVIAQVEEVEEPPPTKTKVIKEVAVSSDNGDAERKREERLERERLQAEQAAEAERLAAAEAARQAAEEAARLEAERREEERKRKELEANTCASIDELEDAAMLGTLNAKQSNCLEQELSATSSITEQRKISNIMINNALAAKNWSQWEKYTKRHLDKYDRSNANMCYGFAVYMFNQKKFSDAIVWSDRGLEQKQSFSAGEDYKKKVYTLYKLKTMAANTIWSETEKSLVSISDDATREKEKVRAESYQSKTKNFAREWLDYARSSGQATNLPMQICVSAATKSFCE